MFTLSDLKIVSRLYNLATGCGVTQQLAGNFIRKCILLYFVLGNHSLKMGHRSVVDSRQQDKLNLDM